MVSEKKLWERAIDVWQNESQSLLSLNEIIDRHSFQKIVMMIAQCKGRIITSGVGTSAAAAKKIAHTLSCIERPAFFLSPVDAVHGALGSVQEGDIVILISKGGGTKELINMLTPLERKKAHIIGVTENEDSYLARESDLLLKVKVEREADSFNMLATSSTMAVIAVFDAICVALMDYTGFTRQQFALIHPGGAVGERLAEDHT